jgi:Icc protein
MDRRMLMRGSLAATFGARALPLLAAPAAQGPAFTFAFITDNHIQPELAAAKGCFDCFRQIARESYDFVLQGGDHIYDALEVNFHRAQSLMDLYVETEQVIGHKVYHVLGNHDCFGIFPKSGASGHEPEFGKQFYIQRFGPTYYSFDHKGVHVVVLDSIGLTPDRDYEGRVDAEQLRWLAADLARMPKGQRVLVATHIPLVTALACYEPLSWKGTKHNWTYVDNVHEVLAVLRPYNVIAVLQGHSHVAERVELNGIPFITGGSVAGNWWQGRWLGTEEGYMAIHIDGQNVHATYKSYGFQSVDRQDVDI